MTSQRPAGSYGTTSGSDDRGARSLMEQLMVFDLGAEIERLRSEVEWADGDRNSRTLAKEVDFRVLLSLLRRGAELTEADGDARVSIQVVHGAARLTVDDESVDLPAGALAAVDAGPRWQLTATTECAVLLTLAWPREKAGV